MVEKSSRRRKHNNSSKKEKKPLTSGSRRRAPRNAEKRSNSDNDAKEHTDEDFISTRNTRKGSRKGTRRKVQAPSGEKSALLQPVSDAPPGGKAAAAAGAPDTPPHGNGPTRFGTDCAALTYGLDVTKSLQLKGIFDPERDERVIKGHDPDNPTPEQLKRLHSFVNQMCEIGVKGLLDEFEQVKPYNVDFGANTAAHNANPNKNRYGDIFCIDPTRVILRDSKDGDYINANWVKGPPFLNEFICAQGPVEESLVDFWRMIVQEHVGYIVMLCDIYEMGRKKCEKYIPEKEGDSLTFGEYKVRLIKSLVDGHFINSILAVEIPDKQARIVYHHQWKNWPDRGVPMTALAGLRVLRHARLTKCSTLVHCSAGVGRTGTLVAIEYMLQTVLHTDGPYDMREMVKVMRNQRAHAIQTAPQYAYIVQAVIRKMVSLDSSDPNNNAKYQSFAADMKLHAPQPAGHQPAHSSQPPSFQNAAVAP